MNVGVTSFVGLTRFLKSYLGVKERGKGSSQDPFPGDAVIVSVHRISSWSEIILN